MSDDKIELKVEGMACEGCAKAVTRAVQSVDPKAEVRVDLAAGTVGIASSAAAEKLAASIAAAGYEVRR